MKISAESLYEAFTSLLGNRVVRLADATDTVSGVQPYVVIEPASEEEVATALAFADREGVKVLLRGRGTQLNTGLPPTDGDILLSLARLNQVIEHAPHDMTVTAQAGLKLVDLQSHLAHAGQWLALDPVLDPEATLGGIISTNISGARRLRYGGVRDQIIGIRVVLADGTIAKGGGKVVKNVAGYDLPKLFTGALGTLGVIVTATFRLYPKRPASRTVVLLAPHPQPLFDLAVRIIGSTLEPTIVDVMSLRATSPMGGVYVMAVRFEMEPESADAQAATLVDWATAVGVAPTGLKEVQIIQGEVEARLWQQVASDFRLTSTFTNGLTTMPIKALTSTPVTDAVNALILKASVLPTNIPSWLETLEHIVQEGNFSVRWRAHAGHGLIFVRLAGEEAALVAAVDQLRLAASADQGNLVVLDAPPTLARTVDVWGTLSGQQGLEVMRHLKMRFDPNYTLNPGRFVGGI